MENKRGSENYQIKFSRWSFLIDSALTQYHISTGYLKKSTLEGNPFEATIMPIKPISSRVISIHACI